MDKLAPPPPPQSAKKFEMGGFASITDDLLHNILKKLPASSFASAACVSKSWSLICNRIISRPKLASALSSNPSPLVAVKEVVDKVLSEPIRPQFAIASVVSNDYLDNAEPLLLYLEEKLGSRIPIVLTCSSGIMGRDVHTDEFKEVFEDYDSSSSDCQISLTVGYLPGIKVKLIQMLLRKVKFQVPAIDKFVMDIRHFSSKISGRESPAAIIMFGHVEGDLKLTMEKMDYGMPMETIVVGDEKTPLYYRVGKETKTVFQTLKKATEAVALVFARDRYRPTGTGDIQFHATLSSGVSAIGPKYKALSVREEIGPKTWLTARREGGEEILDGETILNDINDEIEDHIVAPDLYIGVTKRRKCSIPAEKSRVMTFLSFHGVQGGDEEYLFVDGAGIRTGDYFQFYYPDPQTARSSCNDVTLKLEKLKLEWSCENSIRPSSSIARTADKKECIGGFIFSCCGRGESFLGESNVDSSTFLRNFPGVPLAGIFCGGEIGRGVSNLNPRGSRDGGIRRCLHVYSSVYLLISYTPPH